MQEYVKQSEVSNNESYHRPNELVPSSYSQEKKKSQSFLDVFLHQTWIYPNFQTTFLADVRYILTIAVDMKAIVSYAPKDLVFLSIASPRTLRKPKENKNNFDI